MEGREGGRGEGGRGKGGRKGRRKIMPVQETSIKTQKDKVRSFQVGEHVEVLREWCAQRRHRNSMPFPHTLSYASLSFGCS